MKYLKNYFGGIYLFSFILFCVYLKLMTSFNIVYYMYDSFCINIRIDSSGHVADPKDFVMK
jgi:hypothetical protein